jgi:tetratricopeptide (TPR) repeat protein
VADLEPTKPEDIEWACARLRSPASAPRFPAAIARGLEANDPDQMRAATNFLIERGQTEGVRELAECFRNKKDFGVWARVTSSRLHQISGEFTAGLADVDELFALFPERAGAHWWVAKSRCLVGLGRDEESEAAIREGSERFPDLALPRVVLANLLSRRMRYADSLVVWRDLLARFATPEPDWYTGLAGVLKALGRSAEAVDALETFAARFPDHPEATPLLAQSAEERGDWARAFDLWEERLRHCSPSEQPQLKVNQARVLFRLIRPDEAIERLEALLARQPDCIPALRELAHILIDLGDFAAAREILTGMTDRFADLSRPKWWAWLARARHEMRDFDGGATALAELERRFPDSPLAEAERLRLDHWRECGQDDLTRRVEGALQRFPLDFGFRADWVQLLLGEGRLELAEPFVEALEADAAPGKALVSRLRLEADRGGDAHVRGYAEAIADRRDWAYADAVEFGVFLLNFRTPWSIALGCSTVDRVAERFSGSLWLMTLRARLKIRHRDDAEAIALIDAIPQRNVRPEVLELRAWAHMKRGKLAEAKRLWRVNIKKGFFAAIDGPMDTLERLSGEGPPPVDGDVTAYIVYRNEAPQLPGFLAHHRKLGVRRFVFFDHMSTDESCDLLLAEPDCVLYRSRDSYQLSSSGRRWVKEVVAREGARGWGLQVDPDEYFIYPGYETTPVDRFVAYLEGRGFEAVRGYMLDVFPRRLLGVDGAPAQLPDHRYYDEDYHWIGHERPPYLSPTGGVRARLFGAAEFLHKTPLWRLDAGELLNSHETTPLALADVTGALIHYKMMNMVLRGRDLAPEHGALPYLEPDAPTEVMRRHSRYVARLSALSRVDLPKPGVSRELTESMTLAERGVMEVSEDYRRFVRSE